MADGGSTKLRTGTSNGLAECLRINAGAGGGKPARRFAKLGARLVLGVEVSYELLGGGERSSDGGFGPWHRFWRKIRVARRGEGVVLMGTGRRIYPYCACCVHSRTWTDLYSSLKTSEILDSRPLQAHRPCTSPLVSPRRVVASRVAVPSGGATQVRAATRDSRCTWLWRHDDMLRCSHARNGSTRLRHTTGSDGSKALQDFHSQGGAQSAMTGIF